MTGSPKSATFTKRLLEAKREFELDEVTLQPRFSEVKPPEVDLGTRIGRYIKMRLPILTAPMDTITEGRMASVVANSGGLGVIHRHCSTDKQIREVMRVKRARIVNPEVATQDEEGRLAVAAAVGFGEIDRAKALSGIADLLVYDATSAALEHVYRDFKSLAGSSASRFVVGNFGTSESIAEYCDLGIAGVKVGCGVGSTCTIQDLTGVRRSQLAAVAEVRDAVNSSRRRVAVIADGGLRTPGDIAKVLAVGATAGMLGRMVAGTSECPKRAARTRGKSHLYSATPYRDLETLHRADGEAGATSRIEGLTLAVPTRGSVQEILKVTQGCLHAALGLVGAKDIARFQSRAILVVGRKPQDGERSVVSRNRLF